MGRILDPETGEYLPGSSHPVFQGVKPVDPETLPKAGVDPYASVDTNTLSQASSMTVAEMVQMASIAEARGERTLAMEWKVAANNRAAQNMVVESSARLEGMAAPQHRVNPGKGIVEPTLETPYGRDSEWLEINAKLQQVTASDGWKDDPDTRANVANLQASLAARQQDVLAEAYRSGAWTDQDQGTFEAKQSLAAKAAQVTEQMS